MFYAIYVDCQCNVGENLDNSCDRTDGTCLKCKVGFPGNTCSECAQNFAPDSGVDKCTKCIPGQYGANCNQGNIMLGQCIAVLKIFASLRGHKK